MALPSSLRLKQSNNQEPKSQNKPKLPSSLRLKKPKKSSLEEFGENIKEIPGQFAKGTSAGLFGGYGNILDILGLQAKEELPGQQEKRSREFQVLEKMEKGEVPSYGELLELSDDEPGFFSRLPTSPEVHSFMEEFLGAKKPKTISGRYAQRAGEFTGGGLSFGQTGLGVPTGAAAAGQTLEELNAPPWAQAAAEIGTALKLSKARPSISSGSPEIQKELERLKNIGLSDKDLTLARNALEDRGYLKKSAKYTREAENRFKETNKNIQSKVDSIIEESFPGLKTEGPEAFKNSAVELYDSLDNFAREVTINRPEAFVKAADKAIEEMERTLAKSPQKQEAINMITQAKETAGKKIATGDQYTNFYKELNSIGNWGNPKQREAAFGAVKNAIKDTFKEQGPDGVKLAEALEKANESWMKYLNAKDLADLMERVTTEEGVGYKKLSNILDKAEYKDIFKKGIGEKQTINLKKLSDAGSEIGNLEKAIKGGVAKDFLHQGTLYGFAKAALNFDLSSLKTMIGVQLAGRFATKLLTDPSYQNIALKMAEAAKDQKWNIVKSLSNVLEKKAEKDLVFKQKVKTYSNP